jgi:thiamine biosynthesis lipoprotein
MIRSIEFRAMNTTVMLAAEGDLAIDGMHAAKAFIDSCEQRFSRFLPASENSALNRSAGEWAPISDELMEMLQLSVKYYRETHGIFDPSILADLKRVGYDRSIDEIRLSGIQNTSIDSTRTSQPGFKEISFNLAERSVRLPPDVEIDLSGIAKGWIVEKAAQLLHAYVPACGVSAGGDILFIGQPSDGMDWDVYLEDPRNPAHMLAQLHIAAGAVATSSITKRSWIQGQHVRHHLIDPRTGEPAETEWLSVTVICPAIIDADVYAKAILIGGTAEASAILQAHPEIHFIAVGANGKLAGSPNFKDYLYESATDTFISNGITSQTHR